MKALERSERTEMMDDQSLSQQEMEAVLRYLDRVNRWFGGHSLVLKRLQTWSEKLPKNRRLSILDVGTGSGDLPLAISRWAEKKGRRVRVVGLEKSPDWSFVAKRRCAHDTSIEIQTGDVFDVNDRFDFVVSSLVLHHIGPTQQMDFLRHCDRLSAQGIFISDLERSWSNLVAVKASSFLWGNHVVRYDAPLSVRRSLTLGEAESLIERANLPYVSAQREPWCRLSIGGCKS
jgi:2-polyprenyl-3-methyl-5-hydroxy-6-metoxy-1,4-benzoquinol methylase